MMSHTSCCMACRAGGCLQHTGSKGIRALNVTPAPCRPWRCTPQCYWRCHQACRTRARRQLPGSLQGPTWVQRCRIQCTCCMVHAHAQVRVRCIHACMHACAWCRRSCVHMLACCATAAQLHAASRLPPGPGVGRDGGQQAPCMRGTHHLLIAHAMPGSTVNCSAMPRSSSCGWRVNTEPISWNVSVRPMPWAPRGEWGAWRDAACDE